MSELNNPLVKEDDEENTNSLLPFNLDDLQNTQINLDAIKEVDLPPVEFDVNAQEPEVQPEAPDVQPEAPDVPPEEEEEASWLDMYGASAELNSPIAWTAQSNYVNRFDADPDFQVDPELVGEWRQKFGSEQADEIKKSTSQEEQDFKVKRAEIYFENLKTMGFQDGFGLKNTSAMIGQIATDPATLAMVFATRGMYIPKIAADVSKLGRYGLYAKQGAKVGTAEGFGYGVYHKIMRPWSKEEEILYWMAGGTVGGSLGNLISARILRDFDLKNMADRKMPVTQKQSTIREGEDFWSSNQRVASKVLWDEAEDLVEGADGVWHVPAKDWQTSKIIPYSKQDIKAPKGWLDSETSIVNIEGFSPAVLAKNTDAEIFGAVTSGYGATHQSLQKIAVQLATKAKHGLDELHVSPKGILTPVGRQAVLKYVTDLWKEKGINEIEARLTQRHFETLQKNSQSDLTRRERTERTQFMRWMHEGKVWNKGVFNEVAFSNVKYKHQLATQLDNHMIDGKPYLLKQTYKHPTTNAPMFIATDGKTQNYFALVQGDAANTVVVRETGEMLPLDELLSRPKYQDAGVGSKTPKLPAYDRINSEGHKVGWYLSNKEGQFIKHLSDDQRIGGDARFNAVRAAFNHRAMSEAEEAEMLAGEALTNFKRDQAANEAFYEKMDLMNLPFAKDLQNVPVARYKVKFLTNHISAVALASQSQTPEIRSLAFRLGTVTANIEDMSGKFVPAGQDASTNFLLFKKAATGNWGRISYENKIRRYKKTDGLTPEQIEEATTYILNGYPLPADFPPISPRINKFIQDRGEFTKEMLRLAKEDGVLVPEQIVQGYGLPRQYKYDKTKVVTDLFDPEDLKLTFGKMVYRELTKDLSQMEIDDLLKTVSGKEAQQVAYKAGAAYLNSIKSKIIDNRLKDANFTAGATISKTLGGEDDFIDTLRGIGRNEAGEVIDEDAALSFQQINEIVETLPLSKKSQGKSRNVHARQRMKIDDKGIYQVKLKDGGLGRFTLSDMLETNATDLIHPYIYRMSGARALARVGIDTDEAYSSLVNAAIKSAEDGTPNPKAGDELAALDYMYKTIRGSFDARGHLNVEGANLVRRAKQVAFIWHMAKAGFMAMVESGLVASENGLRTHIKNSVFLKDMMTRGKNGKLNDTVGAFLEDLDGRGTDLITGRYQSRYADSTVQELLEEQLHSNLAKALGEGQRWTSILSLLAPVTVITTRYHSRNSVQHFYDMLVKPTLKGKEPNLQVYHRAKLRQMNLTPEMLQRIAVAMKKHTTVYGKGEGFRGRMKLVKGFNTAIWQDQEAAKALEFALGRDILSAVQTTNPSHLRALLKTEEASGLGQFLSFSLASQSNYTEKFLPRLIGEIVNGTREIDGTAWRSLGGMYTMAALVTIFKIWHSSLGREDAEEYLEKHLTFENVAKRASFSTGFTGGMGLYSVFEPDDPVRHVFQPPALTLFTDWINGGKDILGIPFGESISEAEARNIAQGLIPPYFFMQPLQNAAAAAATDD